MNVNAAGLKAYASTPRRSEGAAETAPAPSQPQAPVDSFGGKIGREAVQTGIAWGNAFGTTVGGAGALTTATVALYSGVLGGAMVGAALGGGFGPVFSSITSHGALDFIGQSFQTVGLFAKAGMVVGGVAGAAGAVKVGYGIGNAAGKATGFVLGAPVGAVKGVWSSAENAASGGASAPTAPKQKDSKPDTVFTDLNKMTGPMKLYASAVGGVGMLSGAVGGFTIGASVASAGSLVSGLLARNVALSSISGAAMAGGVVGGALFAVVGGLGGFQVAKGTKKLWDVTGAKLLNLANGNKETLNQKADRLEEKETQLRGRQDQLESQAATNRAFHQQRTAELDARESQIKQSEDSVNGRLEEINGKIEAGGQALFAERAQQTDPEKGESLRAWDGRLNSFETALNQFQNTIETKEKGLDDTIRREGDQKYETQLRPPLEQKYTTLQGQLTDFEGRLNTEERAIASEIDTRYNSEVAAKRPPLESELRDARSDADRAADRRRDAQRNADLAGTLLATAHSHLQGAESDRNRAQQRYNQLNRSIQELNVQKGNLQHEHRAADSTHSQLESELRQCQNSH